MSQDKGERDPRYDAVDALLRRVMEGRLWSDEQLAEIRRDPSHIPPNLLTQYCEGQLSPEERAATEEHLRDCLYCIVESTKVLEVILTNKSQRADQTP